MSGMSIVQKDTDGCAKQYRCDLSINFMTLLSYSYGTIMDRVINASGHGKNVVDEFNAMYKHYFKG